MIAAQGSGCVARTFLSAKRIALFREISGREDFCHRQLESHPARISVCSGFFARTGMSAPHKQTTQAIHTTSMLDHLYSYRRMLPHYQKSGSPVFITFCKLLREPFPPNARHLVLECCIAGHGRKFQLHAAVVMPDHVHLILTPLKDATGWPFSLPAILKSLKGASARAVNRYLGISGPVWQEESFDHVLRNDESLREKIEYIRQNPVRKGLVSRAEDYSWLWIEPGF